MTIAEYLRSGEFLRFVDETLRRNACDAVDRYLHENDKPAAKAQVYAIPAMLQARGPQGLEKLAANQVAKDEIAAPIKDLWQRIGDIIKSVPGPNDDLTLRNLVIKELQEHQLLLEETGRKERKENRERLEQVLAHSVGPYFEHFVCHYFFRYRRPHREQPHEP